MLRKILLGCIVSAIATLALSNAAQAQRPGYYQPPGGSPFSNYLNLFRPSNAAPLDNYNSFVVPRRQLSQSLQQQNYEVQQLQNRLNTVQGQLQQVQRGSVRPTGNPGTFMNYSHYYSK
jgi:hypothetical protein